MFIIDADVIFVHFKHWVRIFGQPNHPSVFTPYTCMRRQRREAEQTYRELLRVAQEQK